MAEQDQEVPQTGDNPNKQAPGATKNPGDLKAGDIKWITLPPNMDVAPDGTMTPKAGAKGGKVTTKTLSGSQRRDLAGRIRAKLRLAATKKPE